MRIAIQALTAVLLVILGVSLIVLIASARNPCETAGFGPDIDHRENKCRAM